MYSPLVTIIIPVYNGANFLREAIDAALKQTYKNIEIIVINDGSNDNGASKGIALSYGNRITYYEKENGGVSSALNYVLERMHGEWFSWLSHDDLYYPQKIDKQVTYINKLIDSDPQIDINRIVLHTATESIDINRKVIHTPSYKDIDEKEVADDVIIKNIYNYRLSGCSFLVPYSAYKTIGGFREDIRTVSDVEYWYRLIFNGYQFYCLKNEILVQNRSHGKQVGKTKVALFNKEVDLLYADIFIKYKEQFNPSINRIKSFYYGLVKRNIVNTKRFVKKTELKQNLTRIDYILTNFKALMWSLSGKSRNIIRYLYRKIYVR